ncbi:MAG TPA: PD-(D/E)XK nuclease family transposase [Clostridia bacterium]
MNRKKLIRFDWSMKYILGNKANFDVLEGFISNLLKEEIKIQNILESESNQDEEVRKFNRVDLLCIDSQGRQIIIEIQNQREVDYLQRLLWGASKTVVDNLELGRPYKDVVKVISISILYFPIGTESEYIYKGQTEFLGVHSKKPLVLYGKSLEATGVVPVKSTNVFPEYYLIDVERFEDKINEEIDEWIYFFKHGEIREDFKSPGILLASQRLDILSMNSDEKKAYEKYLAYLASERDILETSREEGIKEGEKKKEQEIIQRLIEQGFSEEQIKAIIGHE